MKNVFFSNHYVVRLTLKWIWFSVTYIRKDLNLSALSSWISQWISPSDRNDIFMSTGKLPSLVIYKMWVCTHKHSHFTQLPSLSSHTLYCLHSPACCVIISNFQILCYNFLRFWWLIHCQLGWIWSDHRHTHVGVCRRVSPVRLMYWEHKVLVPTHL